MKDTASDSLNAAQPLTRRLGQNMVDTLSTASRADLDRVGAVNLLAFQHTFGTTTFVVDDSIQDSQ